MLCAGTWMDPSGRRDTVDNHVDLPHTALDPIDGLLFDVIRKSIAVNTFGRKTVRCCELMERNGVIVASGGGPSSGCRPFIERSPASLRRRVQVSAIREASPYPVDAPTTRTLRPVPLPVVFSLM